MSESADDSLRTALGTALIFFVVATVVSLVIEWALFGGDRVVLALATGAALGGLFTVLAIALAQY